MGQAKQKRQFLTSSRALFARLGSATTEAQRSQGVLQVCQSGAARWLQGDDPFIQAAYAQARDASDAAVREGLCRFLDTFFGALWPCASSADPELDLFVGVPVQVLPTAGDVIGDFDDTGPLRQALAAALDLEGCALELDPGLFDLPVYESWPAILATLVPAKNDPLRAQGPRASFRFSEEIAVAPVTRMMWARLSFEQPRQLSVALTRLEQPVELENVQAALPYTLRSFVRDGQQTCLAGVRALAVAAPFTALRQWAFHEGETELQAALRDLQVRQGLTPSQLQAQVAVVEQPAIALPEGVLGAEEAAAALGRSEPQVQIVLGTEGAAGLVRGVGRVMFARSSDAALATTLQAAVRALAAQGVPQVALARRKS